MKVKSNPRQTKLIVGKPKCLARIGDELEGINSVLDSVASPLKVSVNLIKTLGFEITSCLFDTRLNPFGLDVQTDYSREPTSLTGKLQAV